MECLVAYGGDQGDASNVRFTSDDVTRVTQEIRGELLSRIEAHSLRHGVDRVHSTTEGTALRIVVGAIEGGTLPRYGAAAWPLTWLSVLGGSGLSLVPMDLSPANPTARLKRMIDCVNPIAIIVDSDAERECFMRRTSTVLVLTVAEIFDKKSEKEAKFALRSDAEESHIFFTSGSSGVPKAVCCSVGALKGYCVAKNVEHRIEKGGKVLLASTPTFDPSLGDIVATLLHSEASLHVFPPSQIHDIARFAENSCATHILTAPAISTWILEGCSTSQDVTQRYPHLTTLVTGGEAPGKRIGEVFGDFQNRGKIRYGNTYGVTECTGYQTVQWWDVGCGGIGLIGSMLGSANSVCSIGAIIMADAALSLRAQTRHNKRSPNSTTTVLMGELHLFGPQVAQGYLNDHKNPAFWEHNGMRGFATGDIVELCFEKVAEEEMVVVVDTPELGGVYYSEGDKYVAAVQPTLRYAGRRDTQIKINGQRADLGEVNSALSSLGVSNGILSEAVGVKMAGENSGVVAFCVLSNAWSSPVVASDRMQQRALCTAIRRALQEMVSQELPSFLVPSIVLILRSVADTALGGTVFPLNASAKMDLHRLASSESLANIVRCSVHDACVYLEDDASLMSAAELCNGGCFDESIVEEDVGVSAAATTSTTTATLTPLQLCILAVAESFSQVLALSWHETGLFNSIDTLEKVISKANFSDISGDSLSAVQVCKAVWKRVGGGNDSGVFGETLPPALLPRELLKRPQIGEYAKHLITSLDPTHIASLQSQSLPVNTAQPNLLQTHNVSPLIASASAGHIPLMKHIMDRECGNIITSITPTTNAFMAAVLAGEIDAAGVLLERKMQNLAEKPTKASDDNGKREDETAVTADIISETLRRAVTRSATSVQGVAFLFSSFCTLHGKRYDPDAPNPLLRGLVLKSEETLLHTCARGGGAPGVMGALLGQLQPGVVKRGGGGGGGGGGAVRKGISPELMDVHHRTPLHWAAMNGHADLVSMLCSQDVSGIDSIWPANTMVAMKDAAGETAVQMAERRAVCAAADARPEGMRQSVFGSIAKILGGSGGTQNLKKAGRM